jgi:hypothetical protein
MPTQRNPNQKKNTGRDSPNDVQTPMKNDGDCLLAGFACLLVASCE